MAIESVRSAAIILSDSPSPTEMPLITTAGRLNQTIALVAVGLAASAGSTYRVARVGSHARISEIAITNDALGGSAQVQFGLYDTPANGGAVVNASLFNGNTGVATAATSPLVRFPSSGTHIANAEKRLWEFLGLARDPGKAYDITLTLNVDAVNAGNIAVRTTFVQGN